MRTARLLGSLAAAWSLSLSGCTGHADGGTNGSLAGAAGAAGAGVGIPAAGASNGASGAGSSSNADPNAAGVLPLRRLTAREYLNTVHDLLGDSTLAFGDVPNEADDTSNNAFPFRTPTAVGTTDAKNLETAAEQLAQNLAPNLAARIPCSPSKAEDEAACATQFINTFGQKIYRRPLSSDEATDLQDLYQTGRSTLDLDFKGAIALLVEAMLQAPGFLYHWELDPGPSITSGTVVQLGNYQVANRLSYFLWGSMPDDELFRAAQNGELSSPAGVEQQARRMLQSDKAKDAWSDFFDDWLDINTLSTRPKDPALYPQWNQTLAADMENELRAYGVAHFSGNAQFSDLLTGTSSQLTQGLAAVYGVKGISGSSAQPATFDAQQRSGLFTLAGFLTVTGAANGSSPVRRGHKIYTRLMCQKLPDPPGNVPPAEGPTPDKTTRERFIEHDQNACTGGCHKAMDPIGFGFENYDGVGIYRTTDQNRAVDASGTIELDGQTHTFNGAIELTRLLAQSNEVQTCFATQWLRYALNRWDTADDAASIQSAAATFASKQLDMRELLVAIATARTFRFRKPAAGETVQ